MDIVFGSNKSLFSRIARLITWSNFSHVAIYDRDKRVVIEAILEKGVVITPINVFESRYDKIEYATIQAIDDEYLYRAYDMIGSDYDYSAMLSLVLRRKWDDNDKWYCSELVAYSAGIFRKALLSRITPQDIWKVSK